MRSVWLTKLSRFDGEGYKLKGSGLLLSQGRRSLC